MRHALWTLVAAITVSFAALGDTGTPFPAGTKVEVGTPAGTVTGTLQDRVKDGWITLLEIGRSGPTIIPERSIGFIRLQAPFAPKAATASADREHFLFGHPSSGPGSSPRRWWPRRLSPTAW
jgi:hypothetical protein